MKKQIIALIAVSLLMLTSVSFAATKATPTGTKTYQSQISACHKCFLKYIDCQEDSGDTSCSQNYQTCLDDNKCSNF